MKNWIFGGIAAACLIALSWAIVGVMLAINTLLTATVAVVSFVVGAWASGQVKE